MKLFKEKLQLRSLMQGLVVIALAIAALNFQNCSKARFTSSHLDKASSDDNSGLGVDDNDNNSDGDGDGDAQVVVETCADAAKQGKLQTQEVILVFDDTRNETEVGDGNICTFSSKNNFAEEVITSGHKNDFIWARYEQERSLTLPVNSFFCDAEFSVLTEVDGVVGEADKLKYDDIFYLNLNGVVLASNHKKSLEKNLTFSVASVGEDNTAIPFYKFDWSKLYGADFYTVVDDANNVQPYALGAAEGYTSYTWPESEATGAFDLQFDKEIVAIAGSRATGSKQTFQFVVTGDNDPLKDCYHSEFRLKVKASYYLPESAE